MAEIGSLAEPTRGIVIGPAIPRLKMWQRSQHLEPDTLKTEGTTTTNIRSGAPDQNRSAFIRLNLSPKNNGMTNAIFGHGREHKQTRAEPLNASQMTTKSQICGNGTTKTARTPMPTTFPH